MVPLHPTQLYESAAELLILVFLLGHGRRRCCPEGRTFWSYMILYGISRFVIEFFRGDDRGVVFGTISTSQFISLVLVPAAVGMLIYLSRRTTAPLPVGARAVRRAS